MHIQKVESLTQHLPDGPEERDVGKLLLHVSPTLNEVLSQGSRIKHLVLHDADRNDEKPSLTIYHTTGQEQPSTSQLNSFVISREGGEGQNNLPPLLEEAAKFLRDNSLTDVYDIVLEDHINEHGNHYFLTIYYSS